MSELRKKQNQVRSRLKQSGICWREAITNQCTSTRSLIDSVLMKCVRLASLITPSKFSPVSNSALSLSVRPPSGACGNFCFCSGCRCWTGAILADLPLPPRLHDNKGSNDRNAVIPVTRHHGITGSTAFCLPISNWLRICAEWCVSVGRNKLWFGLISGEDVLHWHLVFAFIDRAFAGFFQCNCGNFRWRWSWAWHGCFDFGVITVVLRLLFHIGRFH